MKDDHGSSKCLWLRARAAMRTLGISSKKEFLKLADAMNVRTRYKPNQMRGRHRPWQWYHADDIARISRSQ